MLWTVACRRQGRVNPGRFDNQRAAPWPASVAGKGASNLKSTIVTARRNFVSSCIVAGEYVALSDPFKNYIFNNTIVLIVFINYFNWYFTALVCYCVGVNLPWLLSTHASTSYSYSMLSQKWRIDFWSRSESIYCGKYFFFPDAGKFQCIEGWFID